MTPRRRSARSASARSRSRRGGARSAPRSWRNQLRAASFEVRAKQKSNADKARFQARIYSIVKRYKLFLTQRTQRTQRYTKDTKDTKDTKVRKGKSRALLNSSAGLHGQHGGGRGCGSGIGFASIFHGVGAMV